MATVAISDDLEKVVAEKAKPKKNVQFAGFAAGIASVSSFIQLARYRYLTSY